MAASSFPVDLRPDTGKWGVPGTPEHGNSSHFIEIKQLIGDFASMRALAHAIQCTAHVIVRLQRNRPIGLTH
jgi:hypothetical protein